MGVAHEMLFIQTKRFKCEVLVLYFGFLVTLELDDVPYVPALHDVLGREGVYQEHILVTQ